MPLDIRRLLRNTLHFGFRQLYTNFAWTYDAVAALVSLGEWQAWTRTVLGFVDVPGAPGRMRLLELAHGPGHLQLQLRKLGYAASGIDLSPQMSRLASQRLKRAGLSNSVARANAHGLPFPDATFRVLVSTFPAEFIFEPQMLSEAWRVLVDGGRLVVVISTIPNPGNSLARIVSLWQSAIPWSATQERTILERFEQAGFAFQEHQVATPRFHVILWLLEKQGAKGASYAEARVAI